MMQVLMYKILNGFTKIVKPIFKQVMRELVAINYQSWVLIEIWW